MTATVKPQAKPNRAAPACAPAQVEDVWIVIPAFNEAKTLGAVLAALDAEPFAVVVVDDGSTDATAEITRRSGAHLVTHAMNLGQGAALQTGIDYALGQGARYLVTFDADGQHKIDEIAQLLGPLLDRRCDIVLGSRFLAGGGAVNIPRSRLLTLRLALTFTRLSTGLEVTDTHNGFRALTRQTAERLRITQHRMAHASQILSEIARLRLRYREAPVTVVYSEYSLAKGQGISNAINILWESITEIFR